MSFVINYTYDTTVTSLLASNPTLYAEYTGAVVAAVDHYETLISTNMTVNISFGWGESGGTPITAGNIGQNVSFYDTHTYADLTNAVRTTDTTSAVQQAAVATLPVTDPTGGAQFDVSTAEERALGLIGPSGLSDGGVGLDSATAFSWSQSDVAANTEDATGVLEHEISEVLGRTATGGAAGAYTLLDMFRYTAAGVRDEPFVTSYDPNAAAYFSYDGTTTSNQFETAADVANGADVGDWAPSVTGDSFADGAGGAATPVTAADLQVLNVLGYDLVACYLPDTRIATPAGEVPVQRLAAGDAVLNHRGETKVITWIGRGKALSPRGRRNAATPVIVRKGALAANVPSRDLHITKGHGLYLDGVLIPVEFLVNHRSIVWDDHAREVEVYHIELARHDVLLANGAPAESYRDDGNRWLFINSNSAWQLPPAPPCAPVLTGGRLVDLIWQRILRRAGKRPGLPVTGDPDLHLLVNGKRLDGRRLCNRIYAFHLTMAPVTVRIASRAGTQDELGLARDPRPLGVALSRLVIWRGQQPSIIDAADNALREGFHGHEAENGFRWTSGDAVLPPHLFADADPISEIDLHVASTTRYPLLQDSGCAAA